MTLIVPESVSAICLVSTMLKLSSSFSAMLRAADGAERHHDRVVRVHAEGALGLEQADHLAREALDADLAADRAPRPEQLPAHGRADDAHPRPARFSDSLKKRPSDVSIPLHS
jgi:hypothetical protein